MTPPRFQFKLRTLFLVMTAAAVGMGLIVVTRHVIRAIEAERQRQLEVRLLRLAWERYAEVAGVPTDPVERWEEKELAECRFQPHVVERLKARMGPLPPELSK